MDRKINEIFKIDNNKIICKTDKSLICTVRCCFFRSRYCHTVRFLIGKCGIHDRLDHSTVNFIKK